MYENRATTATEEAILPTRGSGPRPVISAAILTLVGLALYLPGIHWGLPTTTSWSQDTIAGMRTLGAMDAWPGDWKGRYPPLHYLVLRAVYDPVLRHWRSNGVLDQDTETGRLRFAPPFDARIGLLILIARLVSVGCAIGAALGLWMSARLLTSNEWAALFAALTLMLGAAYTYFAHLGNVDAPSMFWFAWSVYFFVRLTKMHRWSDALWLGLFGSLAVATKDAVAGMYPGMAVVLIVSAARRPQHDPTASRPMPHHLWRALMQWRWLVGITMFILPYLFINGVFHNPDAFVRRMKYWLDITPNTIHAQQYRYPNQFALAVATLRYTAGAVGWPMLTAMIASIGYTLVRHTRIALTVLVPALGYYLVVIARIDFVYSRFLFPPLAMVSILVGLGLADLWRRPFRRPMLRVLVSFLVVLPSVTYALALNAEMLTDSRYRAEQWFAETVDPQASVGAFSDPQYLPRLTDLGYATYRVNMTQASFDQPQPDYLVLSSYNYEDFDTAQRACMDDLIAGHLGYTPVATFRGNWLGTGTHWLGLAGWYAPTPGKVSPTVVVLVRNELRTSVRADFPVPGRPQPLEDR